MIDLTPETELVAYWIAAHVLLAACQFMVGLQLMAWTRSRLGHHMRHLKPVFDQFGLILICAGLVQVASMFSPMVERPALLYAVTAIVGLWGVSAGLMAWFRREDISDISKPEGDR